MKSRSTVATTVLTVPATDAVTHAQPTLGSPELVALSLAPGASARTADRRSVRISS